MQVEPDAPAASVAQPQQTKQCPYCAETILAAAVKCKHCQTALPQASERAAPGVSNDPSPAAGIIGLVFFGALVAWTGFKALVAWALAPEQAAYIVAVWNSLIAMGMVAVFIGLWRRQPWGYSWALGTSVVMGISELFIAGQTKASILLLGGAIGLVAAVAIRASRSSYPASLTKRKLSTLEIGLTAALLLGSLLVSSAKPTGPQPAVPAARS